MSNIITDEGNLALHRLVTIIPLAIVQKILKVPIQSNRNEVDVTVWKQHADENPTNKSFFKFLSYDVEDSTSGNWEWVWKLDCPQKLCFFIW